MDETRERIREWGSRPVEGEGEIARLAESEFTGALVEDGDVLFLLNGRVVGTSGRPAEAFTGGTAYQAPGPALPLLFAMRGDGETTTRGYTNDTPLHEVDATLQESNFTGYVELSENVLSGDYYLVYYGGRPLYAAFVGASGETIVGDEAFERADDEVGIYEVVSANIDVSELPTGGAEDTTGAAGTAGAAGAAAGMAGVATGDDTTAESGLGDDESAVSESTDESTVSEPASETTDGRTADDDSRADGDETPATESEEPDAAFDSTDSTDTTDVGGSADRAASETPESAAETERNPEPDDSPTPETDDGSEPTATDASAPTNPGDGAGADSATDASNAVSEPAGESGSTTRGADAADAEPESSGERTADRTSGEQAAPDRATGEQAAAERAPADSPQDHEPQTGPADDTVFDAEAEWRETTSIPALDPDESEGEAAGTESQPRDTDEGAAAAETASPDRESETSESLSERERLVATLRERTEELETRTEQLSAARERADELDAEVEELESEREQLRERVEELESERAELHERVEKLESKRKSARRSGPASANASENTGPALSRSRALTETNLFVRYGSKSKPTLESVADGATPEEVRTNLRLDEHTQFDDANATVDGEPFSEFLRDTPEYAFVEWAVTVLPFEIRDTGHESGLAELYEALPAVDRAELGGTVEVEAEDEGVEHHDFDVVLRDKMGEALVVADINAARDPVSGAMMTDLVESATAVGERADIGAALYVTESFFEPEALEAAEESTGGGLLSRSSKESYVRTGRKQGYHLCLAESRDGSFYVTVPEL